MKLFYKIDDKPKFSKLLIFAFQQLFAIITATLVVPVEVSRIFNATESGYTISLSPSAALFGAGVGTLIYALITRRKSPVFLGSSFSFISSMAVAFAGAATMALGYLGLIIGAFFAGAVYIVLAIIVKAAGTKWIDKIMPLTVIGPIVALIGLNLAGGAISNLLKCNGASNNVYLCMLCGFVALFITALCSTYGKRSAKLIPFINGILAGYFLALILTIIGEISKVDALKIISFAPFQELLQDGSVTINTFLQIPDFTFLKAFKGFKDLKIAYIITIFVAYAPVALVCFAEHLADHKNLSTVINQDLLKNPGLDKTLLGDGIGSIGGAFFGGCPNTTYGESIACVAITKNASVLTIISAAILAIIASFISPFVAFVNSIPPCVMGGVCIILYGFISVSGLKMIQKVDLSLNKNLFVVATILITGIGGLAISFGKITITTIATSMLIGIILNLVLKKSKE